MSDVVFDHIEKRFTSKGSEVIAVNDLNLHVLEGEFLVLVGPSGCGKTTALRMVAGLEDPTGGNLVIGGQRVNDVPSKDRDIAMVFQNYALYPHMNVYDNMAFGLKMRKVPKQDIDRLIQDAAAMLDIGALLKRKPKELSGGQRQRVALGRAIVRHPQAFLMDEPLSNLDAKLRVQTRAELIKLHHRLKTTTIYVTHDQTEAMTMGSRIAVMNGGVLQQLDTPQKLYDEPANLFVAGFIGSPAMNVLPVGIVQAGDGALDVNIDGARLRLPEKFFRPLAGLQDVVMGIRPEHISEAKGDGWTLNAPVDVLEPLGSDVYVSFRVGESILTGRFEPGTHPAIGSMARFTLNLDRAHFFNATTGIAIA